MFWELGPGLKTTVLASRTSNHTTTLKSARRSTDLPEITNGIWTQLLLRLSLTPLLWKRFKCFASKEFKREICTPRASRKVILSTFSLFCIDKERAVHSKLFLNFVYINRVLSSDGN